MINFSSLKFSKQGIVEAQRKEITKKRMRKAQDRWEPTKDLEKIR